MSVAHLDAKRAALHDISNKGGTLLGMDKVRRAEHSLLHCLARLSPLRPASRQTVG